MDKGQITSFRWGAPVTARQIPKVKHKVREILKEHGFKRRFFKHPRSENYSCGDMNAQVETDYLNPRVSIQIDCPSEDFSYLVEDVRFDLISYFEQLKGKDYLEKEFKEFESGVRKRKSIESRVMAFGIMTLAGIALGINTMRITGNVVGSAVQSDSGIFAIALFVLGLFGMIVSLARR
mgnify:CR=1 FL=1